MAKKTNGNGTEAVLPPTKVAELTLLGDLLAAVTDEIKALPQVWQKLPEKQQREVIDRLQRRLVSNIETAVNIIASAGRPTITATVDQVVFKDGVKAVLNMLPLNPARHDLADAVGSTVLIVVGGAEQFLGGADQVQPDPDQPDLVGAAQH